MDRVTEFSQAIKTVFDDWAAYVPLPQGVRMEKIYDDAEGQYQLIEVGWNGLNRIHRVFLHVIVRDGLVWLEFDGTEEGIASQLVAAGIPKDKIVLAFHPPYKRPYTGYAVA
jgi:hypothetical protein